MHASQVEMLRAVDTAALGARLRSARMARGWTQGELGGDGISTGYVSRIESGARRPTPKVLEELAHRLEIPVEELLCEVSGSVLDEIRLGLDFAELALETGELTEAEREAQEAVTRARLASLPEFTARAHYLLGRAREALGRLDDAVSELEQALSTGSGLLVVHAGIAISRCHRLTGDLALAIEVGERVQSRLPDLGLDHTDEAVQLAVTVAAAYAERGDLGQATRVCQNAVTKAEALSSPKARGAAYWNASVIQAQRGRANDAVPLAARALALLSEGNDARNLARLRLELGQLLLMSDPPPVAEALEQITRAREDLTDTSAGSAVLASSEVMLAEAQLLDGDAEGAADMAARVATSMAGEATLVRVEALVIHGRALSTLGRIAEAKDAYQEAVALLTAMDAGRRAAQLWFDLADLLEQVGDLAASQTAFREAASTCGLAARHAQVESGVHAPT